MADWSGNQIENTLRDAFTRELFLKSGVACSVIGPPGFIATCMQLCEVGGKSVDAVCRVGGDVSLIKKIIQANLVREQERKPHIRRLKRADRARV